MFEGVSRKILGHDDKIMMVKVKFDEGTIVTPHTHMHTQTSYCAKGKFEFTVGEETQIISYGEERPFAIGSGDSVWKLNRRSHFVIVAR